MKNIKRAILLFSALFVLSVVVSCEWLTNPDDNPNRPKEVERGRWDEANWGKCRWN